MAKDIWHFSRNPLAKQFLSMFDSGLSSAFILFAPRRMGKTEFLCKDIQPSAQAAGYKVFYFSFLSTLTQAERVFTSALLGFIEESGFLDKRLFSRVNKIGVAAMGAKAEIDLKERAMKNHGVQELINVLAKKKKVLLLLDEVQVLAKHSYNETFIANLRTALDLHKDQIKVIFTGSSREGLRRMFSQASAPFFHFGQNLPFPELGKEFTDHLCQTFTIVTQRVLDKKTLWEAFVDMDKVPQLARSLVESLALNPQADIMETKKRLMTEIFSDRAFVELWGSSSKLEQLLLREIAQQKNSFLFSEKVRQKLANKLGIDNLAVPSVQSALRVLQKKSLIGKLPDRGEYFIDDPNFKTWIINDGS